MSNVLVEDRGTVRVLTLNQPQRRNALDLDDRVVLLDALRVADASADVRAVVLTGAGEIFCSGGDIASMSSDPDVARRRLDLVNEVARHLHESATPIVTAVEGGAFGLGLSLTSSSDLVVAGAGSRFSASFAKVGLVADTGLFHSLPKRVGVGRARQLLLTARTVAAAEALDIGLVDELVDDGDALMRAIELAELLAAWSAPMVAATRRILAQPDQSLEAVLEAEAQAQVELMAGPEFAEGKAAFLERRRPDFVSV